jgi:hypothetical protein
MYLEVCITSIIRVKRISKQGMLEVTSSLIRFTLMMEVIHTSETSVLTRFTWHHIPEDGIPIITMKTSYLAQFTFCLQHGMLLIILAMTTLVLRYRYALVSSEDVFSMQVNFSTVLIIFGSLCLFSL